MRKRRIPHGKKLLAVSAGALTLNLAGCPFTTGNLVVCEPGVAGCDAGPFGAGSSDAGSSDAGSSDAGSSDAGSSDAGPVVDGGSTGVD